jgi:hypothetical protein
MRTDWDGHYLDGRTPVRRPARLRLTRAGIEISPEGGATAFWPYGEVRQTQGWHAGEEVRLERGATFPSRSSSPIPPSSRICARSRRRRGSASMTHAAAGGG